jgi:hypothetical protein
VKGSAVVAPVLFLVALAGCGTAPSPSLFLPAATATPALASAAPVATATPAPTAVPPGTAAYESLIQGDVAGVQSLDVLCTPGLDSANCLAALQATVKDATTAEADSTAAAAEGGEQAFDAQLQPILRAIVSDCQTAEGAIGNRVGTAEAMAQLDTDINSLSTLLEALGGRFNVSVGS